MNIIDGIFSILPFKGIKGKFSRSIVSRLLYILICIPVCISLLAVALLLILLILWLGSILIYKIYHFFSYFTL